jgi:glycosyltransferase involved in cell wall biosynthesis
MRILHLTNGYPSAKYPTYCIFIQEQIESLRTQGILCEVIVVNPRKKGILGYISGFIRLKAQLLQSTKYDMYHCHHILSAFLLIISNPFKKRKILLAFLNNPQTEINNLPFPIFFNKLIYNVVMKKIEHILVKNDKNLKLESKNVHYIPNGVNMNLFNKSSKDYSRKLLNLPLDKIIILFVSSVAIREQKRYDRFKEVLCLMKLNHGLDALEVLMIDEKRSDIPHFYNACDIHLMTSDYEGSPNSIKEAMSCNMKIVSTNVGNVAELFKDVSNCIMSKSFEAKQIASDCYFLLKSNEKPNSRNKILEMKLDIDNVALKLIDTYKQII